MERRRTRRTALVAAVVLAALLALPSFASAASKPFTKFTKDFFDENCDGFSDSGTNPFFIPLESGRQLELKGTEDGEDVVLTITAQGTQTVDGESTRVVEERETHDGELVEISKNFFVICDRDNSVLYFGEDVDNYKNGQVHDHEGSWRAGEDGAEPGMIMPGTLLLWSRYFQEFAPDVAKDQAENISLSQTVETPAGTFEDCLKTRETTPLEPGAVEFKSYAMDVGIVKDGPLKLTDKNF
jgi:hypothetical protein